MTEIVSVKRIDQSQRRNQITGFGRGMLGITDEDCEQDYAHFKKILRSKWKFFAKKLHPDIPSKKRAKTGDSFLHYKQIFDNLNKLDHVPFTMNNVVAVLEATKGYKSSRDVDFPSHWGM